MCMNIREHCLCVCPYFKNSTQHVLFVLLGWFVRSEVSGYTAAVLWDTAFRIRSKQHVETPLPPKKSNFKVHNCWIVLWRELVKGISAIYKLLPNIYKLARQQQQEIGQSEMTKSYMNNSNLQA